jgi:hypothetical protein
MLDKTATDRVLHAEAVRRLDATLKGLSTLAATTSIYARGPAGDVGGGPSAGFVGGGGNGLASPLAALRSHSKDVQRRRDEQIGQGKRNLCGVRLCGDPLRSCVGCTPFQPCAEGSHTLYGTPHPRDPTPSTGPHTLYRTPHPHILHRTPHPHTLHRTPHPHTLTPSHPPSDPTSPHPLSDPTSSHPPSDPTSHPPSDPTSHPPSDPAGASAVSPTRSLGSSRAGPRGRISSRPTSARSGASAP